MADTPQAPAAPSGINPQRFHAFQQRLQQIFTGDQNINPSTAVIEAMLDTNTEDRAANIEFGQNVVSMLRDSSFTSAFGQLAGVGALASRFPAMAADVQNFVCLQRLSPGALRTSADQFTGMMGLDANTSAAAAGGIQRALQGVDEARMTSFVGHFERALQPGGNPIDATITALRESRTGDARADAAFARQIQGAFTALGQTFTQTEGMGQHHRQMLEACADQIGGYATELDGQRPVAGSGRPRRYEEARPPTAVTTQGAPQVAAIPRGPTTRPGT